MDQNHAWFASKCIYWAHNGFLQVNASFFISILLSFSFFLFLGQKDIEKSLIITMNKEEMSVMNIFFMNMLHMGGIGLSLKRKCLLNGPRITG